MSSFLTSILFASLFWAARFVNAAPAQPKIIVIVADDMGFSDIGCYGSEIQAPNIWELTEKKK